MAATDQTYRNQKALDVVFGVSCVLMLLSVLWMLVQDYRREFKAVQREFRDVEEALNEHAMLDKLPDSQTVQEKRNALDQARARLDAARASVHPVELSLMAQRDTQDNTYRMVKADYDSKMSYYNIAIEHYGKAAPQNQPRLKQDLDARTAELDRLSRQLADAQHALDETDKEIREKVTRELDGPQQEVARAEDDLKKLTAPFDRFAKAAAQRRWKVGDTFRSLPILDAFESPTKIKQVWLPDLTIDYSFKEVPRFDRCVSCHLAIDRGNFDKATLVKLTRSPEVIQRDVDAAKRDGKPTEDLERELAAARKLEEDLKTSRDMLIARAAAKENLGFDPKDLPDKVRWLDLTRGQVTQYAAHPRLDLFCDANSPHPVEKFGCTICHAGQGSATDFLLASHTPADSRQEEEWHQEYHWQANHFWDYPMLSSRFVESSCLKCHHQVTDLVRYGSKEEAAKLLRGYHLVRENGCFGCHEIAGIKSGREVGPDMRLEQQPALEYLSAAEQDRARSDPLNPPGTYRKPGPSLRRIAEKTNQTWARKWLQAPRNFRPDTRMPHFYNLSNNNPDPSALEPLPDDQKPFPAAEIHSIAYYLFAESREGLEGKDTARQFLEGRVSTLQGILKKEQLEEKNRKELLDVSRRLADLALLSAPLRSQEINAAALEQRQLQDRLQELHRKQADLKARPEPQELSAPETAELAEDGRRLDEATKRLIAAGKPVPLAQQLVGEDGEGHKWEKGGPPPRAAGEQERAKHADNGRRLFSEKGCLACHSHSGTEKAGGGLPAVASSANFAPNLSRIAAKIAPEVGDGKDVEAAKRRWLVQWIMNPTVYHPRTMMPITHLSADDAADVAEWLLSQEVKDWTEPDPAAPPRHDLVALARVYLAKAPGMTSQDVDDFLPAQGDAPGIPQERLALIRDQTPDADELQLAGPVTDDKLKWYIGRKSITRLGCFGCHDVPGFETAKPVGTALNDWGKKDPERLAFEDADIYARLAYHIVPERNDPKDPAKPAADWHAKDGKEPVEKIFYEALEHHQRQGFLHLKLLDPRSYDYHRIRTWEDRLRMPQFRFARSLKRQGESDEDYAARLDLEEAEAREAVMTFILGLVGEAVPLKYLPNPNADRQAEVRGRHVLDKFNCAGCHQVRPGVYEIRQTPDALDRLTEAHRAAESSLRTDYHFMNHNAWEGPAPTSAERLLVYGSLPHEEEINDQKLLIVRLTEALRFTGNDGVVRDLPAGIPARLIPGETKASPAYGGAFADLMVDYLTRKDPQRFKPDDPDNQTARSVLPPPLNREGERVQPNWLYGFLRNPGIVRPADYMALRMPKFNMSPEEARALVDYFVSSSRLNNPGAGVSAQYLSVAQREPGYWGRRTKEYVDRLGRDGLLEARVKEMGPAWELALRKQVADAEAGLDAARQAAKDAPEGDVRKQKEKELADREGNIKRWKEQLEKKDFSDLRKRWESEEAYASDAFRLIANRDLCLQCHSVGSLEIEVPKAPNLALAAERLRPEWTRNWIANPTRLFPYSPAMPSNFPNDPKEIQSRKLSFVGSPLETVEAVRDVLMDLPRLSDLPAMRSPAPPAPAGGGK
jgi:mono/diheme cytochrome c family protein